MTEKGGRKRFKDSSCHYRAMLHSWLWDPSSNTKGLCTTEGQSRYSQGRQRVERKAVGWEANKLSMEKVSFIIAVHSLHLQLSINPCKICIIHVQDLWFCYCDSLGNNHHGYLPQENGHTGIGLWCWKCCFTAFFSLETDFCLYACLGIKENEITFCSSQSSE